MYQYVRPSKVLTVLQWLKSNNPLYKDIEINSDWLSDAAQDDSDLWEALSARRCPLRVYVYWRTEEEETTAWSQEEMERCRQSECGSYWCE